MIRRSAAVSGFLSRTAGASSSFSACSARHLLSPAASFAAAAATSLSASRSFLTTSPPMFAKRASSGTKKSSKKASSQTNDEVEMNAEVEEKEQHQQSAAAATEEQAETTTTTTTETPAAAAAAEKKSTTKKGGKGKGKGKKASKKASEEQQEANSNSNALVPQGAYIPMNGTVENYSKDALTREGRFGIIEAPIWVEDACYHPILARGKKNVYEHTDDIPMDVKPMFGDTQIWQTREYFEYRRNAENIKYRMLYVGSAVAVFLAIAGGVAFTRIWIDQPSEVATIRRTLLGNSYGRVLELAAGQGINIGVYPFAVTDVVLVDANPQELHILRSRLPKTAYPTYQVVCDKAEELGAFPDHCFDTVVDMFGLCHYKDPVRVLQQMQRVCKPTGQILLLEHGRTDYSMVNWLLDYKAEQHYQKTQGCQWNKDLRQIFKDAGLVVRHLETQHYGTTFVVVAHPKAPEKDLPLMAGGEPAQAIMNTETPAWGS